MLTLAQSYRWRAHLEKEIKVITWEQYETGYIDLDTNDPFDTTNCKVEVSKTQERLYLTKSKAAACINNSVRGDARVFIDSLIESPYQMWIALRKQYDRADFVADYYSLVREFDQATFTASNRNPQQWFNTLNKINDRLGRAGNKKSDIDMFTTLLQGIKCKRYDIVHNQFSKVAPGQINAAKLEELKDAIEAEYQRNSSIPEDDFNVNELLSIHTDIPYFNGKCHKCKQHGHRAKHCPLWKLEGGNPQTKKPQR